MKPLFTRVHIASMATFLKISARISAIGTVILVRLILGWQVTSWILTDEWNPFPISRALSLAHLERPAIYVTASVSDRPKVAAGKGAPSLGVRVGPVSVRLKPSTSLQLFVQNLTQTHRRRLAVLRTRARRYCTVG